MEQTLNIYLDYDSPHKADEYPNPTELAKKYGLDEEEDDRSDEEDERLTQEKRSKLESATKEEDAQTNVELVQKVKQLTGRLSEKNREIDKLCCLLEAVEPIPGGVDPEKFLKMFEASAQARDAPDVDYRDVKIVDLAKKTRKLNLALNKERSKAITSKNTIDELTMKNEKLKKELDLMSSPAARAAAIRNMRADIKQNAEETDIADLRKEMKDVQRAHDSMKRKLNLAQEENKKLTRALAKEVGEGVGVNQVLEDGWRGRAQQILSLKNKVKKMENDNTQLVNALQQAQNQMSTIGTNPGLAFNASANYTNRMESIGEGNEMGDDSTFQFDANTVDMSVITSAMKTYGSHAPSVSSKAATVDSKATARIESMTAERQQAIESLIADRERLMEENESMQKKATALKSRIKILENDSKTQKESMKVLIDKTDSDDQLVELLKAEIARLKENVKSLSMQLKQQKQDAAAEKQSRMQHVNTKKGLGQGGGQKSRMVMDQDSLELELQRVKRLLDQQASQLDTQDEVIRKLRSDSKVPGGNVSYY